MIKCRPVIASISFASLFIIVLMLMCVSHDRPDIESVFAGYPCMRTESRWKTSIIGSSFLSLLVDEVIDH